MRYGIKQTTQLDMSGANTYSKTDKGYERFVRNIEGDYCAFDDINQAFKTLVEWKTQDKGRTSYSVEEIQ